MLKRNNSYQQQSPRYQGLRARNVLQFMSALIVPLMLGVFTIVTTFHQQKMAREQRLQDLNESRHQRFEDLNETRNQRSLGESLQRELATKRYQDDLLVAYINAMAKLLEKYDGSLISDNVASTIARVKTLTTFRQLDAQRNFQIVRFLYEAKQLTDTPENRSLDLSAAELYDIDFRNASIKKKSLHNLSLTGVFLMNATFLGLEMERIRFADTEFDIANFSLGRINHGNFSFTIFHNANFSYTRLDNVDFSSAELDTVNYSSANILNAVFNKGSLRNINFSFAQLVNVDFLSARLENVDFSYALLNKADFSFTSLSNVNFSNAQLINVNFPNTILNDVDFSFAKLHKPYFFEAQLTKINFASTALILANFRLTKVSNTTFQKSSCVASTFDDTSLSDCNFWHSNLKEAKFKQAKLNHLNFSRANLYKTDFTGTNIGKSELENALSIEDAVLSNGTLVHDANLINNGQGDCNIPLINGWTLGSGNVTKLMSNRSNSNCQFTLESLSTEAAIYQRVNLSDKWDSSSWPYSQAVLMSSEETLNSTKEKISLLLNDDMWELEVFIKFNTPANLRNMNNYWCDDIKLYIVYGTDLELTRVIPNIPANATWAQNGVTVAGGKGRGDGKNQLNNPNGLFVDDDQTVVIADMWNDRIVQWMKGDTTNGKVVAGGNDQGNILNELNNQTIVLNQLNNANVVLNQLNHPTDVLIDKETDSLIICDDKRVVRWSREINTGEGEILIENVKCYGLAMDDQKYLYVSDTEKHEVRRYKLGENNGTLVAGGNGNGDGAHQLNEPRYLFVDRQQNVYVSDSQNHRVMKWKKGAKEGEVVAGSKGSGNALTQLSRPQGLFVDTSSTLYVADSANHRVMRWTQEAKQGTVIVGGKGEGTAAHQFKYLGGLSFDRNGNLYVVDYENYRVQRFSLE
ncbi:unnamed protein product [Rotaria magnacalcarata]|uniref:Uncharacterized protein n=4 Tax=Rotaria magnacalcarata TaxID=392030 RepID=A0A815G632_9BILA|nr:unnamed protein product [Rotaria magnacalcarata]CAF4113808.1 unnamed protein product [Rotaria magnacalcarata]